MPTQSHKGTPWSTTALPSKKARPASPSAMRLKTLPARPLPSRVVPLASPTLCFPSWTVFANATIFARPQKASSFTHTRFGSSINQALCACVCVCLRFVCVCLCFVSVHRFLLLACPRSPRCTAPCTRTRHCDRVTSLLLLAKTKSRCRSCKAK